MAYILKNISAEEKEKILNDANSDAAKKNKLMRDEDFQNLKINWAIDCHQGNYMFSAPISFREQASSRPYYIFFKKKWYQINTESPFGDIVYFDRSSLPEPSLCEELKKEIAEAFSVYGRYGWGPKNERGDEEFAISPQFKEV